MSDSQDLVLALAVIIAAAKIGAWLSGKAGQPAVVGELLAGLALGPSALNFLERGPFNHPHLGETILTLGEVGVLLLMFVAGMEVSLPELLHVGRPAVLAGALGVALPLVSSLALLPFGYSGAQAVMIGIVLSATSVSISAQTLLQLGKLRSPAGLTLLGAAVIDDVLVLLLLSSYLGIVLGTSVGGAQAVLVLLLRMLLFLVVGTVLALRFLPRLLERAERWPVSEAVMSSAIVALLVSAWAAEAIGAIAGITGAFLAGLALSRSRSRHMFDEGMHTLNYAVFVPVFLVSIGLQVDIGQLAGVDPRVVALICVLAVLSKVLGSGLGARLGGLDRRTSIRVGAGMMSRGEVGLIVASAGVSHGLLEGRLLSLVVVVIILTTVLTPVTLRLLFRVPDARLEVVKTGKPKSATDATSAFE
jgi:Kef-type K+ transport system membrane component KefB